jgi:hypothetical protein
MSFVICFSIPASNRESLIKNGSLNVNVEGVIRLELDQRILFETNDLVPYFLADLGQAFADLSGSECTFASILDGPQVVRLRQAPEDKILIDCFMGSRENCKPENLIFGELRLDRAEVAGAIRDALERFAAILLERFSQAESDPLFLELFLKRASELR